MSIEPNQKKKGLGKKGNAQTRTAQSHVVISFALEDPCLGALLTFP